MARADGFGFGPGQGYSRLQALGHLVIVESLAVIGDTPGARFGGVAHSLDYSSLAAAA
jgi:hypothetical protein